MGTMVRTTLFRVNPQFVTYSRSWKTAIFRKISRACECFPSRSIRFHKRTTTNHTRYDRMIERLKAARKENGWELSEKIFGWLACSKRPLLWHEIQAALVMDQDRASGRLVMRYQTNKAVHTVHEVCGALVQVLKSRITFVHPTAREYVCNRPADTANSQC